MPILGERRCAGAGLLRKGSQRRFLYDGAHVITLLCRNAFVSFIVHIRIFLSLRRAAREEEAALPRTGSPDRSEERKRAVIALLSGADTRSSLRGPGIIIKSFLLLFFKKDASCFCPTRTWEAGDASAYPPYMLRIVSPFFHSTTLSRRMLSPRLRVRHNPFQLRGNPAPPLHQLVICLKP